MQSMVPIEKKLRSSLIQDTKLNYDITTSITIGPLLGFKIAYKNLNLVPYFLYMLKLLMIKPRNNTSAYKLK